jgi:predicted membrane protein
MEELKKRLDPIYIIGIILLIAGGLLLLDNFDLINFNMTRLIISWQMIFIVIGVLIYAGSENNVGLVFILLGCVFLLSKYFDLNVWAFWPVILIVLGLYFIFGFNRRKIIVERVADSFSFKGNPASRNVIDEVAIFGGGEKSYRMENFEGGNITAIFGGSEIDLYDCKLAPGTHYLDVTAIFGGFSLIVPRDWNIEVRVFPLFGGFSDQRRKDPNANFNKESVLVIKGFVMFGGGEVK